MNGDKDFEARLARRLKAYATERALMAGSPNLSASTTQTTRARGIRVIGIAAALLLAVTAGLGVAAMMSGGRGIGLDPSAAPSTPASELASIPPAATQTAGASPSQTLAPSISPGPMVGDVPPANAEPPSGVSYLPGLQAADVWDALTIAGYECRSVAGMGFEDPTAGWTIQCDRSLGGAQASVAIPYWSLDHVVGVFMTVLPEPLEASIDDPRLVVAEVNRLTRLDYEGSSVGEATAWVAQALADSGCTETPCQAAFGRAAFTVQLGERGSRIIRLDGHAVAP